MTPAIDKANKAKIKFHVHEYEHDPSSGSYGEEASEKLGINKARMFKTLVVSVDNTGLAVAVLPVSKQLDLKLFARAVGAKKVIMADKKAVERSTGYVLGGVSPIGQKRNLVTIIDESAKDFDTIFVSAGRRGLDIELLPDDLSLLTGANFGDIGR